MSNEKQTTRTCLPTAHTIDGRTFIEFRGDEAPELIDIAMIDAVLVNSLDKAIICWGMNQKTGTIHEYQEVVDFLESIGK